MGNPATDFLNLSAGVSGFCKLLYLMQIILFPPIAFLIAICVLPIMLTALIKAAKMLF